MLSFQSDQYGIGAFDFTPLPGHAYTAVIRPQTSAFSFTQNLPEIEEKGYAMNVNENNDSNLLVTVSSAGKTDEQVYLLIHKNENTAIAKESTTRNGKTTFSVSKNALPDGASYFTIFNNAKQPICERLYYKEMLRKLKLTVASETENENSKPLFAFAPEYNGHIVEATLTSALTKQAQKGITAYLSAMGKGTQFYPGVSDENGMIRWETKDFYGASKLVAQTNEEEDSGYAIHLFDPFSRQFIIAFSAFYVAPKLSEHFGRTQHQHTGATYLFAKPDGTI